MPARRTASSSPNRLTNSMPPSPGVRKASTTPPNSPRPGLPPGPHVEAQVVARVLEHALVVQRAQHGVGDLGLAAVRHRLHAALGRVDADDELVRTEELDVHVLAEADAPAARLSPVEPAGRDSTMVNLYGPVGVSWT